MTPQRFYRWSATLPFLVPILAVLLTLALRGVHAAASARLEGWAFLLVISLVIGGVPYLVLALPLLRWLRGRSLRTYRRLSLVVPIPYAALLAACVGVYFHAEDPAGGLQRSFEMALGFGAWGLGFGYFYVALAHLLYLLLFCLGGIDSPSEVSSSSISAEAGPPRRP